MDQGLRTCKMFSARRRGNKTELTKQAKQHPAKSNWCMTEFSGIYEVLTVKKSFLSAKRNEGVDESNKIALVSWCAHVFSRKPGVGIHGLVLTKKQRPLPIVQTHRIFIQVWWILWVYWRCWSLVPNQTACVPIHPFACGCARCLTGLEGDPIHRKAHGVLPISKSERKISFEVNS